MTILKMDDLTVLELEKNLSDKIKSLRELGSRPLLSRSGCI